MNLNFPNFRLNIGSYQNGCLNGKFQDVGSSSARLLYTGFYCIGYSLISLYH